MINLKDLAKQLELTQKEIHMAMKSMWIKEQDGCVTARDSKRITDWAVGYKEF